MIINNNNPKIYLLVRFSDPNYTLFTVFEDDNTGEASLAHFALDPKACITFALLFTCKLLLQIKLLTRFYFLFENFPK